MSLLVTVAASAILAVAGVADVNAIELAMHAVLIEFAVGYAAGNTAIDVLTHVHSSLPLLLAFC